MTQWGLDTLFNPAKRHMEEEKQRLQSHREEVGDSSGGRRIDLESGKVTIRKAENPASGAANDDSAKTDQSGKTDQPANGRGERPASARIEAARKRRARQKAAAADHDPAGGPP